MDSTLSRTEGIDWLAARRGGKLSDEIRAVTERAMNGEITLQSVYQGRLELIRPTRDEIALLGAAYIATLLPGAVDAVQFMQRRGIRAVIVSGGIREAILPLAAHLGLAPSDVHAVSLEFAPDGEYQDFDHASPLARNGGKPIVVRNLELPKPVLALGDGVSDAELRTVSPGAVQVFAAFTGVAARPAAVRVADHVVHQFSELAAILQE